MSVSLLAAFLGGTLALLSPCAALLMPAFFASTVGTGRALLVHSAVFFLGLITILAPLGLGAGAVGALFATHRQAIVLVASVTLIALGALQVLGVGFDAGRLIPGSDLHTRAASASGFAKTFLLGMASGVGGFCAGPILGAVLTLAATQDAALGAVTLMIVYGLGMVAPLVLIAAAWQRLGTRGQRVLRGRTYTIMGRTFHSTSALTGALIMGVGILFWTTNGLAGAPELVPLQMQSWLQAKALALSGRGADVALIILVAVFVLVLWALWHRRRQNQQRAALGLGKGKTDAAD